jgi:transcriptional regulator with XRE-family HTH domain
MITFGTFITRRRKDLGLTQKEVAVRIKQDDGKALSVQYLNDIEHGRRGAPPDYVIKQLARVLRLELDVVYFRAGAAPRHLEGAASDGDCAARIRGRDRKQSTWLLRESDQLD